VYALPEDVVHVSAISVFWVHTAAVETFTGAGPTGDTYAASVDVKGFLDDGVVLVRTSAGEQLVQKSIFYAALSDADKFVPESRITVNGKSSQVSTVRRRDGGSLGLPDHIEVDLG
jgi:hypothetical protein